MSQESLPVHEAVQVIGYVNVYKTEKWWKVVALVNQFGHDKVVVYQWLYKNGKWKRKQKMSLNNDKDWEAVKAGIEKFLPKMRVMRSA